MPRSVRVTGIVARVVMAECLYDGIRTGANTTSVAVSRLDHLAAGVNSTNNTTHGDIRLLLLCLVCEDGHLVLWERSTKK